VLNQLRVISSLFGAIVARDRLLAAENYRPGTAHLVCQMREAGEIERLRKRVCNYPWLPGASG
jgi:hypothetical protein